VVTYLKVFSFRPQAELEELERLTAEKPQMRAAQKALAEDVTTLVHGADNTAKVIAASKALFGQGDLAELDEPTLRAALSELPGTKVAELVPVAQLLADTGLVASRGAGRRTINEGGAYVNNRKVESDDEIPSTKDLLHGRWLVLRRGKRTLGSVEVAP
jgi:tyrosyl-tRNA synthetase